MQTCANCHSLSNDDATYCSFCGTNLPEGNTVMTALKKFRENHRVVSVRLVVADDACPACKEGSGTYNKDEAPTLPHITCSHEGGCRCFYEPMLDEIYP
jgi:hypothetical protein